MRFVEVLSIYRSITIMDQKSDINRVKNFSSILTVFRQYAGPVTTGYQTERVGRGDTPLLLMSSLEWRDYEVRQIEGHIQCTDR